METDQNEQGEDTDGSWESKGENETEIDTHGSDWTVHITTETTAAGDETGTIDEPRREEGDP